MTEWSHMTWLQIQQAAKTEDPLVVLPIGCVETQGPHTPTGSEYIVAERLAKDVAEREKAISLPAIPYGNSNIFRALPGTIYVRPEVLTQLYTDVLLSIARSGFQRILGLVYHVPNEPSFDQAARALREHAGISVVWINPGTLAIALLREVLADPAARGHGAEPQLSLMKYLVGTELPTGGALSGRAVPRYGGFAINGATLDFEGFSVGMPFDWDELYPDTGGYGDVTLGSSDVGRVLYGKVLDLICRLAQVVKSTDPRRPTPDAVPAAARQQT
jgi:creatinine amidohydrolase/Fe(II)-dependent formamide hydrolase-like protein